MAKKSVLVLGATGRIGPSLLEELRQYDKDYEIIVGIHKTKSKDFKSKKIDLTSVSKLKNAFKGIDVVVNLAAESNPGASFDDTVKPSSVHAIRGYELGKKVKETQAPKPLNFYGASKVFGEALCNVFSTKYNLSCLAIRIGAYVSNDLKKKVCMTRDNLDYVISQRDLGQLVHKCIIAPKNIRYGILAGSSNNKHLYMDLSSSRKLVGYKPQDDAFKMCEGVRR